MSEEQNQVATKGPSAPLPTGGAVMAVVPQTVEEIQRVAFMVINSGIAPASLVKFVKDNAPPEEKQRIGKQNVAAVATAIMAGAELGLPPMVALRAFAVINGRPALYADGNVAVVRKAKANGIPLVSSLKAGFVAEHPFICPVCDQTGSTRKRVLQHLAIAHSEEFKTLVEVAGSPADIEIDQDTSILLDTSYGWCEARRSDTDEAHRETFTVAEAKRAGLWDEEEEVEREVWEWNPEKKTREPTRKLVPNDSPWHRYPQRMMMWRPTGYCLRWLFADVLGGMPDEYEARSMTIDITPNTQAPSWEPPVQVQRPAPPPVPDDDEGDSEPQERAAAAAAPTPADEPEEADQPLPPVEYEPVGIITPEVRRQLNRLGKELAACLNEEQVHETFDKFDAQTRYGENEVAIAEAFNLRKKHINRVAAPIGEIQPVDNGVDE